MNRKSFEANIDKMVTHATAYQLLADRVVEARETNPEGAAEARRYLGVDPDDRCPRCEHLTVVHKDEGFCFLSLNPAFTCPCSIIPQH